MCKKEVYYYSLKRENADKRNHRNRFFYCVGGANEIAAVLKKNGKGLYNRILIVGILMYLNDVDMADSLRQIEKVCETKSVICIREHRLSLAEIQRIEYIYFLTYV